MVMKSNRTRFGFKVLSVAALAGCALFSSSAFAQDVTTDIPTYGTGDSAKYYKWETDATTGDTTLVETIESEAQIKANYDSSNPQTWLENSTDISSTPLVGNYIEQSTSSYGGAIFNGGTIGNIAGDFVGNYAGTYGGAIYNEGTIDDITGDFIGNYAQGSGKQFSYGGAIFNGGTIGNVKGDFIGNHMIASTSYDYAFGGAIANEGTIGDITGDFIGNYAKSIDNYAYSAGGGAIKNEGTIGDITGDFIGNYAEADEGACGGAISNDWGTIGNITGNFIGNYASATYDVYGGVINNLGGSIADISGDFVGNYASGGYVYGGAINNDSFGSGGMIGTITGNFNGNYVSASEYAYGGAIHNANGVIGNITGNFNGNYAQGDSGVYGGAIYNGGSIGSIYVEEQIITDTDGNVIDTLYWVPAKLTQEELKNSSNVKYVITESYTNTESEFLSWFDNATNIEEAIQEQYDDWSGSYLIENPEQYSSDGGIINSSFINNYVKTETGIAQGGAIYTLTDLNIIARDGYTSVISGNYVEDVNGKCPEAIRVVTSTPSFETYVGNYAINGTTTKKSIYQSNIPTATTLSLINNTNGKIVIDDQIVGESAEVIDGMYYTSNGANQYVEFNEEDQTYHDIETPEAIMVNSKLNITGDGTGLVQLNNDVINMDITLDNSTLHLGLRDNVLDNNNLTLNSGTLSMLNNQVGVSSLSSLHLYGTTDFLADVDLANAEMDRFTTNVYGIDPDAKLNVVGMNLLSDMKDGVDTVDIMFAEQGLKDNVTYGGEELPHSNYQTTLYTPIYKYNASYDNREDAGYFVFTRGDKIPVADGGSSNPSNAFNPAVLGSSTSATVGAIGTMNQAFNYAFQHSADYMHIPYLERVSMRDRNKYALSITGDATDMGRFSPLYQPSDESSSAWVKPYATFENVPLKNGPKVSNITYGTLVGFDSEMQSLKRGWDRVWTGYIGYNGASQRYSGIDSTQNGGLIGGTMTLYKGNFFNATTVSVGANVANNQTMYGSEDFAMLLSGIGNKTGYNFEFKEGKLILQPSMLMSYTFVNTFDYTNAAGVRIDNKPLHALQLAPGVKVIGNLKGGWQPYASVSMVWNLMGESNATADGVKLPEMSIKPYVQYGVGLQKRIKDHFMAYGQAMVQNGGRNGVSLTAGFRWALGHDNCKYEKTQRHPEVKTEGSLTSKEILRSAQNDRGKYIDNKTSSLDVGGVMPRAAEHKKILKQMTPQQRAAYGGKYASTTRSAKAGMLRQL